MPAGWWSFPTSSYQQHTMFGYVRATRSGDTFHRQEGSSGNPVAVSRGQQHGGISDRTQTWFSGDKKEKKSTNKKIKPLSLSLLYIYINISKSLYRLYLYKYIFHIFISITCQSNLQMLTSSPSASLIGPFFNDF